MLYVGIDQHTKQLTVCVRRQSGEIILRRQVSTRGEKIQIFFEQLRELDAEFCAIVEVCGFNDWLIAELRKQECREIVLIHPEKTSKKKTDRRDANNLCEMLWMNRDRLEENAKLQGMRRVYIATHEEQENRQLTALRKRVSQYRTRTLNKIHRILHRYNLMWDYPTKTFQTKRGRDWLARVTLPAMDRLEMNMLLEQWELWDQHLQKLDEKIAVRSLDAEKGEIVNNSQLLTSIPGLGHFGALTLSSRIGAIERFPRPRSLSNYFGLTPGCRNSGNTKHRLGSITKEGSGIARFVLGQLVVHILKVDRTIRDWYRGIKSRRGSKIARVAVMRRVTTIIWHMLAHQQPYHRGGPPPGRQPKSLHSGSTKGDRLERLAKQTER